MRLPLHTPEDDSMRDSTYLHFKQNMKSKHA